MLKAITLQDLTQALDAAVEAEVRPWNRLGLLLIQVEETGYWQGTAESFSEWLRRFSARLELSEASLWRYLVSSRYYESLCKKLATSGIDCLNLWDLSSSVSAENLEILGKLERVTPDDEFISIATNVINAEITRAEMRRRWESYRPALAGRTARGTGVEPPKVNLFDPVQFDSFLEAQVVTTLRSAGPSWTGVSKPSSFHIVHRVRPVFDDTEETHFEFDAVALLRSSMSENYEYHGIEIGGLHWMNSNMGNILRTQMRYCNFLWFVLDHHSEGKGDYQVPDGVGLVVTNKNSVKVIKRAEPLPGIKTGDLAKGLLQAALK